MNDELEAKDGALVEAELVLGSIKKKADKYRLLSRLTALTMSLLPLCIPISLLLFAQNAAVIIVSTISAVIAGAGSLLSLERPYERWSLYRKYHRLVHAEIRSYRHKIGKYSRVDSAAKRLVETILVLELQLHDEWAGLVPSSASVLALSRGAPAKDKDDPLLQIASSELR